MKIQRSKTFHADLCELLISELQNYLKLFIFSEWQKAVLHNLRRMQLNQSAAFSLMIMIQGIATNLQL